jgi:transcriptional regulator with XRE-family HTH domain
VVILFGAKRARQEAGFTLQKAAKELGVSVTTLWRWEAGRQTPSIEKIRELAELYGVSAGRLIKPPRPTRYEIRKSETLEVKRKGSDVMQGDSE